MISANFDFREEEMTFVDEEMIRFIKNQQGKNKSEGTVHKYAKGLEQFSDWLRKNDKSHTEVDFIDIENYLSYLVNKKDYADKTTHIKFVPVRMYYSYLEKLSEISENPVDNVDTTEYYRESNTKKEEREFLSKEEVKELADAVPAPRLRNRLVILFMYYTGLRRSEVSRVKLDNLDQESRTVEVEVKGGNKHTAVWHRRLDGLMKQWLEYGYRDAYPTADDSPYLFVTNSTEQLSAFRMGRIVDKAADNAGLQEEIYEMADGRTRKKISCHTLRHSFAMNFLNDGGSFEALNNRLAHSSISTTELYGEVEDDRGISEYNEFMQPLEMGSELEEDECLLCENKGNLDTHHISYEPEQTIYVCKRCHGKIHNTDKYQHLLDAECETYESK